jgi:predicted flap endonuclease-1-like 5' DNA nuclease
LKLTDIIGLEDKHANLLAKEDITTIEELLKLTSNHIKKLAKKLKIPESLIDTWQEHADLMRIEGIDPRIANALNLTGIDSVKELARRNPKNLLTQLIEFIKSSPKALSSTPTETQVEEWINKAKILSGTPPKKRSEEAEVPIPQKLIEIVPFTGDYGDYGPEYWNGKWEKAPIIYTGRALRGESYKKEIDVDVKAFIKNNDAILWYVISQLGLRKDTANDTAWECQKFVCNFLKYKYDDLSSDCPEFWQFPFETIQSEIADCEDGAILIAALLINAGIPSWRVKVCAAQVMADPEVAPSDTELGGHAYCIYLADLSESDRKLEWVVLDWCYLQDPEIPIEKKPLARDGGQEKAYKDIWFTFNDEFSWSQTSFEVKEGRISNNRKLQKDEVLIPLKDLLKSLASEELEKILRKEGLNIE